MSELMQLNNQLHIEFNAGTVNFPTFEQAKETLDAMINKYRNLVVTADKESVKSAKETRAELNKIAKALEDKRKEIKKEFEKPLKKAETQLKELVGIVNVAADEIKAQLDEVEEQRKREKMTVVDGLVNEVLAQVQEEHGLQIEITFDNRWLNATAKEHDIKEEIKKQAVDRVAEENKRLANEQIVITFCETLGVTPDGWLGMLQHATVQEVTERIKASENAKKARLEQLEREEVQKTEETKKHAEKQQEALKTAQEELTEVIATRSYTVTGGLSKLAEIETLLEKLGVTYTVDDLIEKTEEAEFDLWIDEVPDGGENDLPWID